MRYHAKLAKALPSVTMLAFDSETCFLHVSKRLAMLASRSQVHDVLFDTPSVSHPDLEFYHGVQSMETERL